MVFIKGTVPDEEIHISKVQQLLFARMQNVVSDPQIKDCMRHMVLSGTLKYLSIILREGLIQDREYAKPICNARIYFEWKYAHFHKNLQPDEHAFEALIVEHPRTLQLWKLQTDIANLKDLLLALANGDIKYTYVTLMGCHKLVHILQNLLRTHEFYINMLTHYSFQCVVVMPSKAESAVSKAKKKLTDTIDSCMDIQRVADPIILRYMRKHQTVAMSATEWEFRLKERSISDVTKDLIDTGNTVDFVYRNSMSYVMEQIENLRRSINYWTWKYEAEYEKMDNEVAQSDMILKALQHDVKVHKKRLQFYRDTLRHHFEMERAQREEELQRQLMEQQLLEAKLTAAATKKKKGKKDDKKTK